MLIRQISVLEEKRDIQHLSRVILNHAGMTWIMWDVRPSIKRTLKREHDHIAVPRCRSWAVGRVGWPDR